MKRGEGTAGGESGTTEGVSPEIGRAMERLRPHEHICLFYDGADEWRAVVIPYLRAGLERGHKCVLIHDRISPEEIRLRLDLDKSRLKAHEDSGRLVFCPSAETYLAGGTFEPRAMVRFLERLSDEAITQGYPFVRLVGEVNWAGGEGVRYIWQLLEYEAMLNEVFFPQRPFSAICLYDRGFFGVDVLRGVMMTHPRVIWRRKLYSNPFFLPAERFLSLARTGGGLRDLFKRIAVADGKRAILSEVCADSPGSAPYGPSPSRPAG